MNKDNFPWYKEGLHFKCTGCGKCCTGTPGYVWVDESEMLSIAESLNISLSLFKRKYVRQRGNRYSLIEIRSNNNNYDCVFLKDKKCLIYDARPLQCRTFPWWKTNLRSEESWECATQECDVINDEAPLFSCDEIDRLITS